MWGGDDDVMRRSVAVGVVALRAAQAPAITDAVVVGPMLAALSVAAAVLIQVLRFRS
jgi:hypothetical protein